MSIAEFTAALRNKAYKEWYNKEKSKAELVKLAALDNTKNSEALNYVKSNVNTLINPTKTYKSAEETAAKTEFIITKSTIKSLLIDLKGIPSDSQLLEDTATDIFNKFATRGVGLNVNRRKIRVGQDMAVFFNSISFDGITTLVNNILDLKPGELATKYDKGHVIGVATVLLEETRSRILKIPDISQNAASKISKVLREVIKYYTQLDLDSANIQPADNVTVYASSKKVLNNKGKLKYLVELQPEAKNKLSGEQIKVLSNSVRRLFDPNILSEKTRLEILANIIKSFKDAKFAQEMINVPSSPNLVKMIGDNIAAAIEGKSLTQSYIVNPVVVMTKKPPQVDLSEIRNIANREKVKLKTLVKKLETKAPALKLPPTSNVNLLTILRAGIRDQIQKNMGTGNAKNVLNYRTGRFANSVSIEYLSESRAGMISVFYDYMKNPYATFSQGGKQQYPRSRDPKLLISKSIRDIAAPIVGERLRSVVV